MLFRPKIRIETQRLILRLPQHRDYVDWAQLRRDGVEFLAKWEPARAEDHTTRRAFRHRVHWSSRAAAEGRALPLFLFERRSGQLLGAATLDNIRRGPAQMANLGYWIGPDHARQGLMSEAVRALVDHAFGAMDLSRVEAACLARNVASRGLLEKCGFKYEGVAQAFLQIDGRWQNHVLYANLRHDRRGRTDAG